MQKFKIGPFGLLLAVLLAGSFTVSCARLAAPGDDAITKDIKAKIFSDPLLKNASIDVTTHGQVVTLTGQVPDDSAHSAAYRTATGEKGATKVNDQINVPTAPAEPNVDASPTTPATAGAPPSSSSSQPITVTVPANTVVSVRTIDRINSRTDRPGNFFGPRWMHRLASVSAQLCPPAPTQTSSLSMRGPQVI